MSSYAVPVAEVFLTADRICHWLPTNRLKWLPFKPALTDNLSTAAFMFLMRGMMLAAYKKVKQGGHAYVFIDWRNYPALVYAVESAGWRVSDLIVWDKQQFGMGYQYRHQHELVVFCSKEAAKKCNRHDIGNVIRIKSIRQGNHPTEKPVELLKLFVEMSTEENDVVCDPFSGSGSTLAAAHQLRRRFIGFELESEYVEFAKVRLRQTVLSK